MCREGAKSLRAAKIWTPQVSLQALSEPQAPEATLLVPGLTLAAIVTAWPQFQGIITQLA